MKRFFVFMLALTLVLCMTPGWAESIPAHPNMQPGNVVYNTPVPTDTPIPTDTPVPTDTPLPAAPAQQETDWAADVLNVNDLTPEMIAMLDEQVRDMLLHDGELLDHQEELRNILLVGLDARPGEKRSRSDTMIIITLDTRNRAIKLTSLLRDTYVHIPGVGNNRINAAYYQGGAQLLMDTIEENFGIKVDEYVAVSLTTVVDAIDDLGGLTLSVDSKKQLDAINGVIDAYNYQFKCPNNSDLLTQLGEQRMNGKQVQAYARYRKIDSDFKRTERQREVLEKLYKRVTEKSLMELAILAGRYIGEVNTSLSLGDMLSLLPTLFSLRTADIEQLRLPADGEYQSKTISGMAVLVPNLQACRERLSDFIQ